MHIGAKEVLLDDEVALDIDPRKWEHKLCNGRDYFFATVSRQKIRHRIYLHRMIALCPRGQCVDHIDGNRLNNQRSNLRICTHTQNCQNRGKNKNNSTGFKGVRFSTEKGRKKRWYVSIMANRKVKHLGHFATAREAAIAYNEAARKFHGEFMRLNDLTK